MHGSVYTAGQIFLSYIYVIGYGAVFVGLGPIKWTNMFTFKLAVYAFGAIAVIWCVWWAGQLCVCVCVFVFVFVFTGALSLLGACLCVHGRGPQTGTSWAQLSSPALMLA